MTLAQLDVLMHEELRASGVAPGPRLSGAADALALAAMPLMG